MPRNTEGLKRSARLRRENAIHKATVALRRMEASDREINFRAVSLEARVSTAWLYGQKELRGRIIQLRQSPFTRPSSEGETERREKVSVKNIIATLRLRIKQLEEKNRELTELLERAYGVIAAAKVGDIGSTQ
jgi:Family of unknown function (DUF6262)